MNKTINRIALNTIVHNIVIPIVLIKSTKLKCLNLIKILDYQHCIIHNLRRIYIFYHTYNFVERYVKESSFIRNMSLHLLTVSKRRNVSPTLNKVAKHLAINILVGGPGFS